MQKGIFETMMEKLTLSWKQFFLCSLCLFLFLGGCASRTRIPNVRDTAFSAELLYVKNNTRICSTVQVGAPRDSSDPLPRDLVLTVTSPEALQGLVITRIDGTLSFSYKGILTTVERTDLLRCAELLLSEDPDNTYEFNESTGFPICICTKNERVEISNVQAKLSNE